MQSMTGYGRCRLERDGREMTVELKSVNHRFLDIAVRMPRNLGFLEDVIRKELSTRINRGHVDVFVTYANTRDDARVVNVDVPLLSAYKEAIDTIAHVTHAREDMSVSQYARLPDVLTVSEREEDREAVEMLMREVLGEAMNELCQMRSREGERLRADVLDKITTLKTLRDAIAQRAPSVVEDYRDKLQARLSQLISGQLDEQRLAQEVALFADRAAIDEELVRLRSHFAQIAALCDTPEAVGRRLDFLVQELNREVNTIGSKASDLQIAQNVVSAKAEIEKLREQVQNIE